MCAKGGYRFSCVISVYKDAMQYRWGLGKTMEIVKLFKDNHRPAYNNGSKRIIHVSNMGKFGIYNSPWYERSHVRGYIYGVGTNTW